MDDFGYGDPGYSDPSYEGPKAPYGNPAFPAGHGTDYGRHAGRSGTSAAPATGRRAHPAACPDTRYRRSAIPPCRLIRGRLIRGRPIRGPPIRRLVTQVPAISRSRSRRRPAAARTSGRSPAPRRRCPTPARSRYFPVARPAALPRAAPRTRSSGTTVRAWTTGPQTIEAQTIGPERSGTERLALVALARPAAGRHDLRRAALRRARRGRGRLRRAARRRILVSGASAQRPRVPPDARRPAGPGQRPPAPGGTVRSRVRPAVRLFAGGGPGPRLRLAPPGRLRPAEPAEPAGPAWPAGPAGRRPRRPRRARRAPDAPAGPGRSGRRLPQRPSRPGRPAHPASRHPGRLAAGPGRPPGRSRGRPAQRVGGDPGPDRPEGPGS